MWYTKEDFAKVLIYFGIIPEVRSTKIKVCCPFHGDVRPSMVIDLNSGRFNCFGCGKHGDVFDFIKFSFPEKNDIQCCLILEKILQNKKVKQIAVKIKPRKIETNEQALNKAFDYFYGLKQTNWKKIDDPEEMALLNYMVKRGFKPDHLNKIGCRANTYNIAYPIIFPILDNGEFKGWVSRTDKKIVEQKRKYLYNTGFKKVTTLCGTYEENCIPILCEGFMDFMSIRTKGNVTNVVAILGCYVDEQQVNKLKQKGIKTVVSALDNDEAGKKGKERLKRFFKVIDFPYPAKVKDPGEMTEKQMKGAIREVKNKVRAIIEADSQDRQSGHSKKCYRARVGRNK